VDLRGTDAAVWWAVVRSPATQVDRLEFNRFVGVRIGASHTLAVICAGYCPKKIHAKGVIF
jgi:hypothetical protein